VKKSHFKEACEKSRTVSILFPTFMLRRIGTSVCSEPRSRSDLRESYFGTGALRNSSLGTWVSTMVRSLNIEATKRHSGPCTMVSASQVSPFRR
jgi:hypothetical protein